MFIVHRTWRVPTLYKIRAKSNNPRPSYANCSRHRVSLIVPLTFDLLTLNVYCTSDDQSLYQVWAQSNNPRLNYWRFLNFFKGANFQDLLFRGEGVDQTASNLKKKQIRYFDTDISRQFEMIIILYRLSGASQCSSMAKISTYLHSSGNKILPLLKPCKL